MALKRSKKKITNTYKYRNAEMSNHSPYNNELANKMENIPVPNMDMAWADMEKRLTQKEDKKPIPFWFNGCAMFALVGILLLGIGYWFYTSKNKEHKNDVANVVLKDSSNNVNRDSTAIVKMQKEDAINKTEKDNTVAINKTAPTNDADNNKTTNNYYTNENREPNGVAIQKQYKTKAKTKVKITGGESEESASEKIVKNKTEKAKQLNENAFAEKIQKIRKTKSKTKTKITAPAESNTEENKDIVEKTVTTENPEIKNSVSKEEIVQPEIKTEIVLPVTKDTVAKKVVVNKKRKSSLIFNAGIGMHQQLAINGQTNTPYNSLGRKGTLLDYIPSVYARIEKEKKWFVQIEGKYGAPQYNKEFVYEQINKRDTGFLSNFVNIKTSKLKKSFYHQIPITFNYYITPKWSLGAGVQWNKFKGALAEKQEVRRNDNTQTENVLSKIQTVEKIDSNNVFSKQYTVALFETQYKWRRFTIGAKYSFGLSPYITFTLPNATEQKLTSKTALMFIKYELWRSKQKKK
jgi:hypothetical protein